MLLRYAHGKSFADGAAEYNTIPGYQLSDLIVIAVQLGDIPQVKMTEAAVDTSGPYLICTREIALQAGLKLEGELFEVLIGKTLVKGSIERIGLKILADIDKGHTFSIVVWAFVPERFEDLKRGEKPPSYLGWTGCLDSFRFAVDPLQNTFYFE